ncbi:Preprotein translocase subunit SecG [Candidatus Bealeia paramacronuclearis]|uniref:Protein-export membrane protein SecG n=1 Tax=Candidatus Bealeia paramacronuclearis TaxID=1921001 RepID=A0ABZ2C4Z8_9PROT|nr:Preprotein translocase subunit SecG [Candidatus Bealeia paramacronuclearis]
METVLLAIHLLITIAMIALILIQRSEGGGMGLGGGNMGGLMSARGTANLLTHTTAILAGCFFVTCLGLAILASHTHQDKSILDKLPDTIPAQSVPQQAPGVK